MIWIDYELCTKCKKCLSCPQGVLEEFEGEIVVANPERCNQCCYCVQVCEGGAIKVEGCSS
ncbi:4Fe-4S dicluster domain-containing protein [Archaeoglobus sp.]